MKKTLCILLIVCMISAIGLVAVADGTTKLTTTVPEATYTLSIPANKTVEFGATKTDIGNVTVTESENFSDSKDLYVTVTYSAFQAEGGTGTIPYDLYATFTTDGTTNGEDHKIYSGGKLLFCGDSMGAVTRKSVLDDQADVYKYCDNLYIAIGANSWELASPGTYASTITFTAAVQYCDD